MKFQLSLKTLVVTLGMSSTMTTIMATAREQDEASTTYSTTIPGNSTCGEVIATYHSVDAVVGLLQDTVRFLPDLAAFTESAVVPAVSYGLQVRRVCGSCADVVQDEKLCPPEAYGYDVPHSGLLLVPLLVEDDDEEEEKDDGSIHLIPGTQPLHVHFHGLLRHPQAAPSTAPWPPNVFLGAGFDIYMGLVSAATTGSYTLLPDYQGFGESSPSLFSSTLVQRGYVTATVPLLHASQTLVADELSDCRSAVSRQIILTGYSEGGYAAVAVLKALEQDQQRQRDAHSNDDPYWQVVHTVAGAGAFKPTLQLVHGFQAISSGQIDVVTTGLGFLVPLLAIPFSSTTTDVVNFQKGQDLLDPVVRDLVLETFLSATDDDALNALVDPNDPFALYDPAYRNLLQAAVESGIADICQRAESLPVELEELASVKDFDLLCQAIADQDLTAALENARSSVTLLHSPDDEVITIANLPDLTANPDYLTFLPVLQGGHLEAGGAFGLILLQQFVLNDATRLVNAVMAEDLTHPEGCPAVGDGPEEEFPDTTFKATIICQGGRILTESSDDNIRVCHTNKCKVVDKSRPTRSAFGAGILLSLRCDADAATGLCGVHGDDSLAFTDTCPPGEGAFVTLTVDRGETKHRRLRSPTDSSKHGTVDYEERKAEIHGETVTVHSVFPES